MKCPRLSHRQYWTSLQLGVEGRISTPSGGGSQVPRRARSRDSVRAPEPGQCPSFEQYLLEVYVSVPQKSQAEIGSVAIRLTTYFGLHRYQGIAGLSRRDVPRGRRLDARDANSDE